MDRETYSRLRPVGIGCAETEGAYGVSRGWSVSPAPGRRIGGAERRPPAIQRSRAVALVPTCPRTGSIHVNSFGPASIRLPDWKGEAGSVLDQARRLGCGNRVAPRVLETGGARSEHRASLSSVTSRALVSRMQSATVSRVRACRGISDVRESRCGWGESGERRR
jgi:hypothetical protein